MAYSLYLRAPGEKGTVPRGLNAVIHLDEPGVSGQPVHHSLTHLLASPCRPSDTMQAFLLAAAGVWVADKLVSRRLARDAWTRDLEIHLPVSPQWLLLGPRLSRLLAFLTGDRWLLKFREASVSLGFSGQWRRSWQPSAVALFSGGLDSLVGAIDCLEAGERLLLLSHYDFGQLAATQQALAAGLADHYGPDRLHHLGVRVMFAEFHEPTLRSRSLLYLALALAAAAAFSPGLPIVVPENGWISFNPPLTLNRLGTYSTRTTHPYFLRELAELWSEAGVGHVLRNPYQHQSKGEMLVQCRNPSLLKKLFPLTSSCAHPVVSRWEAEPQGECGYCYPCLMRRAALNRLGWDDGGHYRLDALADKNILRQRLKGADLRALLLAVQTWAQKPHEVLARLWLGVPAAEVPARYYPARRLLTAGFQEIAQFFQDKGTAWIRSYLDWR